MKQKKDSILMKVLASNLIGFCGTDGYGIEGLEEKLDSILTGTPGIKVSSGNPRQQEIPNSNELYVEAENGSNVIFKFGL